MFLTEQSKPEQVNSLLRREDERDVQNVCWQAISRRGETGGERPHKMKSPQTPFLNHRVGKGLGKPEIAGFALSCVHPCAAFVDFPFRSSLPLQPESPRP